MDSRKMGTSRHLPGNQTAIGPEDRNGQKPSLCSPSLTGDFHGTQVADRTGADDNIADPVEHARALQRCKRGAVAISRYRDAVEAGVFAGRDLSRHMWRSLPWHLQARSTTLRRFWFSVHQGVATVALRQVQRSARRLGLTRIADTTRFLWENCRWYVCFCSFSRLLCK